MVSELRKTVSILFLPIFLEVSEGNVSKSDDLGMSQGVTHIDCKAGQTSSKSNVRA